MAIAGKVAITPKGEWNAQTAYTKLDLVFYDNASYVAIQPSTGVEPTNEFYWMLMVQSAGGADLEGIINGDIQVGNAKNLDGHEAEYFATAEELSKIDGTKDLSTSILEKALTLEKGIYEFVLGGGNYSGNDLPKVAFAYGNATVFVKQKAYALGVVLWGSSVYGGNTFAVNQYNGSTWQGWDTLATTADLAKYLPLTGGGTIKTTFWNNVNIQRDTEDTTDQWASMVFSDNNTILGGIGYSGINNLCKIDANGGAVRTILHTGNKPTGTYTGNGDATDRTINTGGIGGVCIVRASGRVSILTPSGGFLSNSDEVRFTEMAAFASDTGIILRTTDSALNESGVTYHYQVL